MELAVSPDMVILPLYDYLVEKSNTQPQPEVLR